MVEKILWEAGSSFSNLDPILETIGKKQPNLLLLSFLIQASKEERKQTDEIKEEEIRKSVVDHLNGLKKSTCKTSQDQEAFRKLIGTLSVLSEFEVPMERRFIDGGAVGNLLERLEKKKEILSLKGRIFDQEYYLLPHSRLASLYRDVCLDEEKRREVLKDYIIQGDFFGTLISRLAFEAGSLLKSLIKDSRKEFIKRDLSQASIKEIGYFLGVIAWADKELAKEIASVHSDILRQKDLSQASIKEIGYFLEGIAWADKELAKEIASVHSDTLRQRISQASIKEIGYFLWGIARADKELAKEIASVHSDTLRQKDLSQASIKEIGYFLMGIARADKELAKEIARVHEKILKKKLSEEKNYNARGFFIWVINAYIDPVMVKRLEKQYRGERMYSFKKVLISIKNTLFHPPF